MDFIIRLILNHRKTVLTIFILSVILCGIAATQVSVNYNLMDYLPEDAQSTKALDIMDEEYDKGTPNVRAMAANVSIPEALALKEKIKAVDGVEEVSWLDDAVDIHEPVEFYDAKILDTYYVDNHALYSVTVDESKPKAVAQIQQVIGEDGALAGTFVNTATSAETTQPEVAKIMCLVLPIVFIILLLTTNSWFEPVLFMATIGAAIVLNMGTNLIKGEISFVTQSAGAILQLAVSMDYSIFLLHRFAEFRQEGMDTEKAMIHAVAKSFSSILSSGLTTVIGFAALILMRFKIGPDMGIVMAKAIALSLLSVLILLPILTLYSYKLIDKTQHKPLIPSLKKLSRVMTKVQVPIFLIFCIIIVPCFLAQGENDFAYGSSKIYGLNTKAGQDTQKINDIFGKSNLMVLMVPNNSVSKETDLKNELYTLDAVTSVVTYTETVSAQIPVEFAPKDEVSQLISDHYSRFVITVDSEDEGEEAFAVVEQIRAAAQKYYGDASLLAGETVNSYDMKDVVTIDNERVNAVSIGAIALVLLINFKSISIPFILLTVIESSIWINLTFPYFQNQTLFYIGYLIISSIQLGATVDYAILFMDRYIENRSNMKRTKAAEQTFCDTALSIMTSGGILTICGFLLGAISTHGVISQLGILVGRGALLSLVLVLVVLPLLLVIFDGVIRRTTLCLHFYKEGKQNAK